MKETIDQIRLFIAETMILWAAKITPAGHMDSVAIYRAALCLGGNIPTPRDNRDVIR